MTASEKKSTIPGSVLNLLTQRWKDDPKWSAFEAQFGDPRRRVDPSRYRYYLETPVGSPNCFTTSEIGDLVRDGVFAGVCRTDEKLVAVNEHAQHALTDFLGEVYRAWDKYQSRVAEAASSDRSAQYPD